MKVKSRIRYIFIALNKMNWPLIIVIILITALSVLSFISAQKVSNSFKYVFKNDIQCGEDECVANIVDLEIPVDINNEYQREVARYCADLVARIEYLDIQDPKGLKREDLVYSLDKTPVFGCIWSSGSTMWIGYRGTMDIKEWVQNFQFDQEIFTEEEDVTSQTKLKFLRNVSTQPNVHSGFLKIYEQFRDSVLATVKRINPRKIIVCGHSLGGAVATINALDLKNSGYDVSAYTFASPKIGDKSFCDIVESSKLKLFRIFNTLDIIPTLPTSVSPNIKNTKQPFFYNDCGEPVFFSTNWKSLVNNHTMGIYIDALEKILI